MSLKSVRKISSAERRAQRTEATRTQLIKAAGRVIGRYGYGGCSIARVTARAKIAHGAFYQHFRSQQELFEQVLPVLGREMLRWIAASTEGATSFHDMERASICANFEFLAKHPHVYRVLQEAEPYVPQALEYYLDHVNRTYARALRRSLGKDLSDEAYYFLATMLVGLRANLIKYHRVNDRVIHPVPDKVLEIYLAFATAGVEAASS